MDFDCDQLDETGRRLHVFRQYLYMQRRVDKMRNMQGTQGPRECVVVIGTPGIGKRSSPYYLHLTASLGKTTFLHYYLAFLLSQKQVSMLYTSGELYIFKDKSTIFSALVPGIKAPKDYITAPCLLDSTPGHRPPEMLTTNRRLFILQAASPDPIHTDWIYGRGRVRRFVLNPPDEDEVVAASVFSSLCLHPCH